MFLYLWGASKASWNSHLQTCYSYSYPFSVTLNKHPHFYIVPLFEIKHNLREERREKNCKFFFFHSSHFYLLNFLTLRKRERQNNCNGLHSHKSFFQTSSYNLSMTSSSTDWTKCNSYSPFSHHPSVIMYCLCSAFVQSQSGVLGPPWRLLGVKETQKRYNRYWGDSSSAILRLLLQT